jgi:MFS family permease
MLFAQFRHQLPLLTRLPNFRWLWSSTIFTAFEEVLQFTALPLYILNLTNSGATLAAMWAISTLSQLLAGPLAGVLADRFNRRRVWLAAGSLAGATYLLYPQASNIDVLFGLIAFAAACTTVSRNAYLAMLPDLVEEHQLVDANAIISMNFNIALTIAPLIAGGLLAASTAYIVFYLLAIMRLCAIFCISQIMYVQNAHPEAHQPVPAHPLQTWLSDLRAGFDYARAHPPIRALLLTIAGSNVGMGGLVVLEALLIKVVLNAGDAGYGLMLSIAGLGAIAGSLLIKPASGRWPIARVFAFAVTFTGLTFFPYAHILWFPATLAIACAQTVTFVMSMVLTDTLVQRSVPDRLRGRIFGLVQIVRSGMQLVAVTVFGVFVDSVGVVPLLTIAGVFFTLAGVYAMLALRNVATPTVLAPEAE